MTFHFQETLSYFGRIFGMSKDLLKERTAFLIEFLDLPRSSKTLVRQMSGGQQRRVSLAAALLHRPQLLILGPFNNHETYLVRLTPALFSSVIQWLSEQIEYP